MLDDYETENVYEETSNKTSDRFFLKKFELDEEQKRETILSMASTRSYIYFLTKSHNIFRVNSVSLETISESYSIPDPKVKNNYKEHFDKIWADREGNHCIIRHNNAIYYFNSGLKESYEIDNFRGKEICAIALDDRNTDTKSTKKFLAVDYDNTIYECSLDIVIDEKTKTKKIQEQVEELTRLHLTESGLEEDDDQDKKRAKIINDRIYGIKFIYATNTTIDQGSDSCYIMAVTKNRLYQFLGPGFKSFKQVFKRYENNPALINETCKHFPKKENIFRVEFDVLYKNESMSIGDKKSKRLDVFNQFGWRTDSGYCFGEFKHINSDTSSGLPLEVKEFTIIPFQKITDKGKKEIDLAPISVIHTVYHIFILYDDCLTVVSKLTSNIIHTEYFDTKYDQMIYNEFSEVKEEKDENEENDNKKKKKGDKGSILLTSKEGVFQISLENENEDIWKDYLDIGDFEKAKAYCNSDELKKKINKIDADKEFTQNKIVAANKYAFSDEKLEIICLKYLKEGDFDALKTFLEIYKFENIKVEEGKSLSKRESLQLNLLATWMIELFLSQKNTTVNEFVDLIRTYKANINFDLIYQILLSYGKMEEYEKFCLTLGEYRRVVNHRINQGQIKDALSLLSESASWVIDCPEENMELLKKLGNVFLENCHLFFQADPEGSFHFLNEILIKLNVDIDNMMEIVILSLMGRTDRDITKAKDKGHRDEKTEKGPKCEKDNQLTPKEKTQFNKEVSCIMKNLEKLKKNSGFTRNIRNQIKNQMSNIHNLYVFYLALNPTNKQAVINFLKDYVVLDSAGKRKNKVLFQVDYAKALLQENQLAYALILSLMGKYSEAITVALTKGPNDTDESFKDNQDLAEYIATNCPDKMIQKSLWLQIFKSYGEGGDNEKDNNSEKKLKKALKILEKSQVLKIEDVLPYITDSIKIEEFKTHISNCISQYENNINELKENIKSYNNTAENIKMDINKINKKPMEIKYNEFKCEICKELIRNKRIFLFPCGHMFDMNCIRDRLLDYENTGLGYLHEDNVKIDKLFYDLRYIPSPVFPENEDIIKQEEPKKVEETTPMTTMKKVGGILSKIKNEFSIGGPKKEDILLLNMEREKNLKTVLYEYLSKHCVLCGNFLVDSVQCSLDDKGKQEPNFVL